MLQKQWDQTAAARIAGPARCRHEQDRLPHRRPAIRPSGRARRAARACWASAIRARAASRPASSSTSTRPSTPSAPTIAQAERMAGVDAGRDLRLRLLRPPAVAQLHGLGRHRGRRRDGTTTSSRLMAGGARIRRARGPHADAYQPTSASVLDGTRRRRDPRGMVATRAGGRPACRHRRRRADAQPDARRRALLSVGAGLVAAPYASALAATSEEERRLGVTCIDIGGGTTTVADLRRRAVRPRRTQFRSAETTSLSISPAHCTRRLRRPSESRRFMARWSGSIRRARDDFLFPCRRRGGRARTGRRRPSWPRSSGRASSILRRWSRERIEQGGVRGLRRRACGADGRRERARRAWASYASATRRTHRRGCRRRRHCWGCRRAFGSPAFATVVGPHCRGAASGAERFGAFEIAR